METLIIQNILITNSKFTNIINSNFILYYRNIGRIMEITNLFTMCTVNFVLSVYNKNRFQMEIECYLGKIKYI